MFRTYSHLFFPFGFILIIILAHSISVFLPFSLSQYGLIPRNSHGLIGIFTAPLIHGSWEHVLSNITSLSITLYVLFTVFKTVSHVVFTAGYIVPGIFTWIFGRTAMHIGASGLVYCLLFFLLCIGLYSKKRQLLAISAIILILNSGFIWGILPQNNAISWEYHIGGSITGCILAFLFRNFSFTTLPISTAEHEYTNMNSTAEGIEFVYTKKNLTRNESGF